MNTLYFKNAFIKWDNRMSINISFNRFLNRLNQQLKRHFYLKVYFNHPILNNNINILGKIILDSNIKNNGDKKMIKI